MFEIRIELVEVESPGGEIRGIPLVAKRSKTYDSEGDIKQLLDVLTQKIDSFEDY